MNKPNQQLIRALIGIVIALSVITILIFLLSDMNKSWIMKIVFITFSMLIYGITGSVCLAVTRKEQYSALGTTGVVISAAAFILNTILMLSKTTDESLSKAMLALLILSISMAHICFLFYINPQNKYAEAARTAAVIFISLFSLLIITKIFDSIDVFYSTLFSRSGEAYARIFMASIVGNLSATLLVALCNRLETTNIVELPFDSEPPADQTNQDQNPVV